MATDQHFVEHLQSQSGLGASLSYKKMFGEYALYLHGKVVAFACDNQLFLKPTDAGRAVLGKVSEHPPYPGAKNYFRIDDEIEDRDLLRQVFEATASVLPLPKPKAAKKRVATRALTLEGQTKPSPGKAAAKKAAGKNAVKTLGATGKTRPPKVTR